MLSLGVYAAVAAAAGACGAEGKTQETPGLEPRGTTLTTVKPTRQDVVNRLSLAGKVTVNPIFGLVAPVSGKIRYLTVARSKSTPTKPTKAATVTAAGKRHYVQVPAGAVISGRLVDDGSNVTAGMPIVSAKHIGYGIVAEIDSVHAYKVADALSSIQAQILGGPGPFPCTVLGTIAALPPGALPPEPEPQPQPQTPQPGQPFPSPVPRPVQPDQDTTEATGMRLVCTPPAGVRMINGAGVTLELVTAKAENVLVLPVEAVAGGQGKGQVDIVTADRTRETREVELGLTDGRYIEITSGLTGDETIAVPGPNLPQPQTDGEPGKPVVQW